jgi:hypothetical protein
MQDSFESVVQQRCTRTSGCLWCNEGLLPGPGWRWGILVALVAKGVQSAVKEESVNEGRGCSASHQEKEMRIRRATRDGVQSCKQEEKGSAVQGQEVWSWCFGLEGENATRAGRRWMLVGGLGKRFLPRPACLLKASSKIVRHGSHLAPNG